MSTAAVANSVKSALSAARMSTYEAAKVGTPDPAVAALELYAWNAQVSAALMAPLHICEVVVRNVVSDALTAVYGPNWPWSEVFRTSLPNPSVGYKPQGDLVSVRSKFGTTGKVIPELKFVFWQKMFTSRYDVRLWGPHLRVVLPNLGPTPPVAQQRAGIYNQLEDIRLLRNRIAHHEPIFRRNLQADFDRIRALIALRCAVTADWMVANQEATAFIAAKP